MRRRAASGRSRRPLVAGAIAVALAGSGVAVAATTSGTGSPARSSSASGSPAAPAATAPSTPASRAPAPKTTACANAPEVLAYAAGTVAQRIYAAEVRSSETTADKRQIEGDAPLLSAVQSGEHGAIEAAVHTLVYSHTHIVRLRVTRGSHVLSDIGGPYILAPVSGTLRSHGATIAHFVFSVQDDLGYVKLVSRFIAAPLILRTDSGQVPVQGLLSPGPASIPEHGSVTYRGVRYQAYSFRASAYPSGRLRVSLLLAFSRAPAGKTCAAVQAVEFGSVAQHISQRFALSPTTYGPYIRLVNSLTHALVYVRAGSRTVAASTRSTPPKLPHGGSIRWHGVHYEVVSFNAPSSSGTVRVHLLVAH
ncbi:MAG: hypothetical protein JWM66_1043 [Solirubrobacterales bacterium]|jgi:hypothetical protein|nr:hypothetical protein [Solirubrobacterales bacterium]